jgi:hypothetical protein
MHRPILGSDRTKLIQEERLRAARVAWQQAGLPWPERWSPQWWQPWRNQIDSTNHAVAQPGLAAANQKK